MTADIKNGIDAELAKKILANKPNAEKYLLRLSDEKPGLSSLVISTKAGRGIDTQGRNVFEIIAENWDYQTGKKIIREMFVDSDKYKRGLKSDEIMNKLIGEWRRRCFGQIGWPFSQGAFDQFVQRVNKKTGADLNKDREVQEAAVRYRRIKEINTARHDYLEALIFQESEEIIPTFSHSKKMDFFVDGIPFDQKVSRGPTKKFKNDFGRDWKKKAVEKPELVAEYLYRRQDEGRFGEEPRLLIVYLDDRIEASDIKKAIKGAHFSNPLSIDFSYQHKTGEKEYNDVKCIVILLYGILEP